MSEEQYPTEARIEEWWNRDSFICSYRDLDLGEMIALERVARAAYDLGKQAREDDGFIPCTFDEIRKGDTVERTYTSRDGTIISVVGVAHYRDELGDWCSRKGSLLIAAAGTSYTYRRKPAEVTPPDPEKHPIILNGAGEEWLWSCDYYYRLDRSGRRTPEAFGSNWTPAKIVAGTEEAS